MKSNVPLVPSSIPSNISPSYRITRPEKVADTIKGPEVIFEV